MPPIVASVATSMRLSGCSSAPFVSIAPRSCGDRVAQHFLDRGEVDIAGDKSVADGAGENERDAPVTYFFVVHHMSDQRRGIPAPVAADRLGMLRELLGQRRFDALRDAWTRASMLRREPVLLTAPSVLSFE